MQINFAAEIEARKDGKFVSPTEIFFVLSAVVIEHDHDAVPQPLGMPIHAAFAAVLRSQIR